MVLLKSVHVGLASLPIFKLHLELGSLYREVISLAVGFQFDT